MALAAQTPFLDRVKSRTKAKVEQRAVNKIDKQVDKTLDEIENPSEEKEPAMKTTKENVEKADTRSASITAYSKYDFVPGKKIIIFEKAQQSNVG